MLHVGENGLNIEALQQLAGILDNYDLSNLTDEQEEVLLEHLNDEGLLSSGKIFDGFV